MALTWLTIATDALRELRVLSAGAVASGDEAAAVLGIAQRLLDLWNADRRAVYAELVVSNVLTPSLQPHTIGPSGTWTQASRPVSIERWQLVQNNVGLGTRIPRDTTWWARQSLKTLTSEFPTDMHYEPAWPNGKLYFWPIPTTALTVELQIRQLLTTAVELITAFTLPPGYQEALTLTIAENSADTFKAEVSRTLERRAREARDLIFSNNDEPQELITRDAGLGMSGSGGRGFNWLNREDV